MSTTDIGRQAEQKVAEVLQDKGWKILELNWRNRWCEIDIIARDKATIYFVEVKYRANNNQGDGFDAITPNKLTRMGRAAEAWVLDNSWDGEYQLLVASANDQEVEIREING